MKIDLFQSCGHCWVFQICWPIECNIFTASSFRIWNSATGIPSPPLEAEHRRIDAFELWCWRRLLRVLWTARRTNQSIPNEISPGCSLEGLMLKLKLQYFGHLMQRAYSFEKTLMLGKIEGRRRRGHQRMRWLDGMGLQRVGHERATEPNWSGLALFVVMLRKAHLTSHSRMSGSRWVITPLWLSGPLKSFLYSSSVYSCHLFFISSASVRSTPFLSFIEPIFAWNVLGISNFLEEISSLSHSVVFLYFFALKTEEGFLISLCCSLGLYIQMGIFFLFFFALCFSSFHSYL